MAPHNAHLSPSARDHPAPLHPAWTSRHILCNAHPDATEVKSWPRLATEASMIFGIRCLTC